MGPALDDAASLQHENLIGPKNRGEPMRDHKTRPVRHQMFERFLDQALRRGIHACCRLIENQNRRILQKRARDREPLLLTHAQFHPALTDHAAQSFRQ